VSSEISESIDKLLLKIHQIFNFNFITKLYKQKF